MKRRRWQWRVWLGLSCGVGVLSAQDDAQLGFVATEIGYAHVRGDAEAFAVRNYGDEGLFGGVSAFNFAAWLEDDTFLAVDGRVLSAQQETEFNLFHDRWAQGRYRLEFHTFVTDQLDFSAPLESEEPWTVDFRPNYGVRRTNLAAEGEWEWGDGWMLTLRGGLFAREGTKASSRWGLESAGRRDNRGILPAVFEVDETRHEVSATLQRGDAFHRDGVHVRFERATQDNVHRAPTTLDGVEGALSNEERRDNEQEIFTANTFHVHEVSERLQLTGSAAFVSLEGKIGGERVLVEAFDPLFRQQFERIGLVDQGYLDLDGESDLRQWLLNANATIQLTPRWLLLPSVQLERTFSESQSDSTATEYLRFGGEFITSLEDRIAESDEAFTVVSSRLETRYQWKSGPRLRLLAEAELGTGDLDESLETTARFPRDLETIQALDYEADYTRRLYRLGARLFHRLGTRATLHLEADQRWESQDLDTQTRRSQSPVRTTYPGYLSDQRHEVTEAVVRLNWRPRPSLIALSHLKWQHAKRWNEAIDQPELEASELDAWIVSEQITWQPAVRWTVFGQVSYTFDRLRTVAADLEAPFEDLVSAARSQYLTFHTRVTRLVGEATRVEVELRHYQADNRPDFEPIGVLYGYDLQEWHSGVAVHHRWESGWQGKVRLSYTDFGATSALDDTRFDALVATVSLRRSF